jgi:hypothetical protein
MATEAEPIGSRREDRPRRAGKAAHWGARVPRVLGWLAFAAALGLTFSLYLRPGLVLDFGMILEMCGLR